MGYRVILFAWRSLNRAAFALALTSVVALAPLAFADDKPAVKLYIPYADSGRPAPSSSSQSIVITKTPADPPPMVERAQWIFDLRWDKGDVYLLGVHAFELPASQATPRSMGRFALELFEGAALIERVRFDFPLLGAGEILDAGRKTPPSFERKLNTRIGVMLPATKRGTRLELWDRATNKRWALPWPPEDTRRTIDGGATTSPADAASAKDATTGG